ncbi:MAG: insulinase family protein [Bdellovibrionaceae bacterium]|nr:insulinase family protein [Pseudobdellovibrionaceae bacterium]
MRMFIAVAFLVFGMAQASAQELKLNVEKYKLKNGMTVLLHKDNRVPMVTVNQWYHVGSYDEEPHRTGLAHFFEHLMFKGTKKYASGSFDAMLTELGASNNAFTSSDYTGYYEMLPAAGLEKVLELEADRMVNLTLDMDEIQKEREVVKEERRMRVDNSPSGLAFETLMGMTFEGHPYGWSVIGSMDHLNATSMDDFKAFYKKYYAPNNSVLVIVGDFNVEQVKNWIDKYYAAIPASEIQKKQPPAFKPQTARRYKRIEKFDTRMQGIFFRVPGIGQKDAYVLDILAEALGGGEDSRLHKSLVDQMRLASNVSAWNYSLNHSGVLGLNINMIGKSRFDLVESEILRELERIKQKGLSETELKRTKDRIMLDFTTALATGSGKGRVLAATELIRGDYKEFFNDLKVYESVTNDEIKQAAKKYLSRNQANVLSLGK